MKELVSLTIWAGLTASGYFWVMHDYEWAKNVVLFYGWLAAVVGTIVAFSDPDKPRAPDSIPARLFFAAFMGALLVLYVTMGYFVLAAFFIFGWAGTHRYRDLGAKLWKEAQC